MKKEFAQNIQIHDVFDADEKDDVKKEKAVKANKELSQLQLTKEEPKASSPPFLMVRTAGHMEC